MSSEFYVNSTIIASSLTLDAAGSVYVSAGYLYVFNSRNGSEASSKAYNYASAPVINSDGLIYIGDLQGKLSALGERQPRCPDGSSPTGWPHLDTIEPKNCHSLTRNYDP